MAEGVIGLDSVSKPVKSRSVKNEDKDLKTGNLKRSYNMPGKACNKYKGKEKEDCLNYRGRFAKFKSKKTLIEGQYEGLKKSSPTGKLKSKYSV